MDIFTPHGWQRCLWISLHAIGILRDLYFFLYCVVCLFFFLARSCVNRIYAGRTSVLMNCINLLSLINKALLIGKGAYIYAI
jgi:hypothetical protein